MSANEESGPQLSGGSADFGDHATFGVLTVSDRASQQVYDDISGPAILEFFQQAIKSKYFQCPCSTTAMSISCVKTSSRWSAVYKVIPDERDVIEQTLKQMVNASGDVVQLRLSIAVHSRPATAILSVCLQCDKEGCCLVVTTGGTGPAPRDVTPEATEAVCMVYKSM